MEMIESETLPSKFQEIHLAVLALSGLINWLGTLLMTACALLTTIAKIKDRVKLDRSRLILGTRVPQFTHQE